ncbi:LytTR family DNA-binding domain-containing protein [Fluviicola sp.]|uniref:LytR/AlgR family response regulator transcription factor n=1 Tax=Fluviicola sp. TaxID=1917219 RepID=UPI0031E35C0A
MKILIVDDESSAREIVRRALERDGSSNYEIREADSVKSAVEQIGNDRPDLLLLDIQLRDETGFDVLYQTGTPYIPTIFITAYNEFALKAFQFSALNYLLKPVAGSELLDAVKTAQQKIEKEKLADQMQVFMQHFSKQAAPAAPKQITLKTQHTIHFVSLDELIYCSADGSYTNFVLVGGEKIMVSASIGEYDELLRSNGFLRTHQSYLVNTAFLSQFDKRKSTLQLKNGMEIPVSSRKKEEILTLLKSS